MPFDPDSLIAGRYSIDTLLGANGNRETWRATDTDDGASVTLKTLFFGRHMQWQDLKLQEREAATLSTLSHPRIPRHRASFWSEQPEGNYLCLVQEYIPGTSLAEKLSSGERLDPQAIRQMAHQVLAILIYLHEQSPPVVHRDIKPSNLIEGSDGSISLIDFGAVQAGAISGQTVTVVGTFGYMPPEQFGGRTTPASDLYALGVTLAVLLTGTSPGDWPEGKPPLDALGKNDLSLCRWLERLTETELARRTNSAREALIALDNDNAIEKPRQSAKVKSLALTRLKIEESDESLTVYIPANREGVDLLIPLAGILVTLFIGLVVAGAAPMLLLLMSFYPAFVVFIAAIVIAWPWTIWKMFSLLTRIQHQTKSQTIVLRGNDFQMRDGLSEHYSRMVSVGRIRYVKPLTGIRTGLILCSPSLQEYLFLDEQGLRPCSPSSQEYIFLDVPLPLDQAEAGPLAELINRWLAEHPGS